MRNSVLNVNKYNVVKPYIYFTIFCVPIKKEEKGEKRET